MSCYYEILEHRRCQKKYMRSDSGNRVQDDTPSLIQNLNTVRRDIARVLKGLTLLLVVSIGVRVTLTYTLGPKWHWGVLLTSLNLASQA